MTFSLETVGPDAKPLEIRDWAKEKLQIDITNCQPLTKSTPPPVP
jgi:hypothetical protein